MATSSIGRTTIVKKPYGEDLLKAIKHYKATRQSRGGVTSPNLIAETRAVGMRK